jgi:hypothetical protein
VSGDAIGPLDPEYWPHPDEVAQWKKTLREDVIWAARIAQEAGWSTIEPGSLIRGIEIFRAKGLGQQEAVKLPLELDDDPDFFRELRVEWYEAGGPKYPRRFASESE